MGHLKIDQLDSEIKDNFIIKNLRSAFSMAFLTSAFIVRVFRKMLFDSRATKVREPPVKESKLKALLKRSSEPFMGIQISQQVD